PCCSGEGPARSARVRACVRDARPEGRDTGGAAAVMSPTLAEAWPGALGHSGIVAYGARRPLWRLGAPHAQTKPLQFLADPPARTSVRLPPPPRRSIFSGCFRAKVAEW